MKGDEVRITVLTKGGKSAPLAIRIPGWATHATATSTATKAADKSSGGGSGGVGGDNVFHTLVAPTAGTYMRLNCAANTTTTVKLSLNPEIKVERGWGAEDANAAVVTRGPLVYALALKETQELLHKPWVSFKTPFIPPVFHNVRLEGGAGG